MEMIILWNGERPVLESDLKWTSDERVGAG